jgi:GntR family transcriptional regulator/MocR family aminotransferase
VKELLIYLQHNSKKALYEQIYEYICQEITDGKISPGEKLPSTRLLAKSLQISRSTAEFAYDQLVAEGYITTKPRAGYYACDVSGLYQWKGSVQPKQAERVLKKTEQMDYKVIFSPFRIDEEHFPFRVWQKANRSVNWEDDASFFHAGDSRGDEKLRVVISNYLHRARGVNCDPGQIVIGAGNEYLLLLLSQILGNNKVVAMDTYTYVQAARTFENMEYMVSAIAMDEGGMQMKQVRGMGADILYVMPSHQFPLGTIMPMKRRMELLQWALEEEDRYIIEDDHDSEFRYKGKPIPSLQSMDQSNRVVYIGTFSKSIAQSVRVSYMVLPKKLMEQYYTNCGFYSSTVPRLQQEVLYHFLEDGSFERHLNRMKNIYKGKQDYLLRLLKNEPWVKRIYGENAGLHMNVEVNTSLTEAELIVEAEKHGVKLFGLAAYRLQVTADEKVPTILLGYGNVSERKMEEGIHILHKILCTEHSI